MSERSTDEALLNPELDLLGLAPHAQRLAELVGTVPTPFTIGVYGEWGAGKTTFAYFVKSCLEEAAKRAPADVPVEFIRFEAWPHKTADELWRALIIRIAAQLYERGEKVTPEPVAVPARKTWGQWLAGDAVLLREGTEPLSEEREYTKLLARLDDTLYGGIGKSGGARWRLDQEQAIVSAVTAGFQALSAASPLVAGIRGLLKLDGGEASGARQREHNEETRARIESIEGFRKLLDELLDKRGKDERKRDRRLCIFLDDLDRCAPDVALDLLDAIKVFLVHAKFVFLVAADEEIIGRGLRIRYRDIGPQDNAASGSGSLTDRLAREGQQYFEKIVQLRIHIPEASPQAAHRFIAAQFPEWMPATDIVFAALGSNPRRVKQYCNWMMFRHSVEKSQAATVVPPAIDSLSHTDDHSAVLNKLVSLYARSEGCLRSVAALAATPAYAQTLAALENHLAALGEDATDEAIRAAVADASLHGLCRQMSASQALFRLVLESPRLSTFDALEVETMAAIADMRPRSSSVLECSDRVFMRILNSSRTASISTQSYVVEEFSRLRTIELNSPALFGHLEALARSCGADWTVKMLAVESRVRSGTTDFARSNGADDDQFDDKMRAVVVALQALPSVAYGVAHPRDLLLRVPRLSDMLREVVLAYCSVRKDLPALADKLLSDRVFKTASEDQKTIAIATHAYNVLANTTRDGIEKRIGLRKWAASHCLSMRSFVKLNALDRNWPDFARRLRRDFGTLRALEAEVVSPGKLEKKYEPLWEKYRDNDALRAFLALPPLFAQIDPLQLQQYLELSQAVSQTGEGGLGTPPPGGAPDPMQQVQPAESEYVNVRLLFEPLSVTPPPAAAEIEGVEGAPKRKRRPKKPAPPDRPPNYRVEFQIEHENAQTADIFLDWEEIDRRLDTLRQASLGLQPSASTRQTFASKIAVGDLINQFASLGDLSALMRELGGATFDNIFPAAVGGPLETLLAEDRRFRFLFEGPNEVMRIPFESLYSKKLRSFLALSQRFSLVRWGRSGVNRPPLPLTVPLRILAVLANPSDSAPLNLDGEAEVLRRAMAPSIAAGRVSLEFVPRGEATWKRIQQAVKAFRPHVFHFVGHGVFGAEVDGHEKRGAIVLENEEHKSVFIAAPEFATLLGDEAIQIAVLNGCDTGTAARNEAISSMADALTNSGVPAVVATMREVADDTALLFTREFYRGVCEGQAVEVALAEARKALSVERRDWSVYALFASMVQLELLRTPPLVPQRGPDPSTAAPR